ncbi:hypothetical protein DLAC_03566 [Tieghemostelium lacteum]|uniref:RNA polymerase II nuclear localization protein SLC7A6OS n=1 Tax=Tieghemostelium lacteum TaxID=361077 RepID=A0A152A157_TIELA|nr:hypothetical protein DLAC_03566 [Tieghemostelium lacteum]|eukprot:KYQ99977.1 hypothetical protein DLAC_03566 [Tieghemostelium lacteum]
MNTKTPKKIFIPNIIKHQFKQSQEEKSIISPTAYYLNEQKNLKNNNNNNHNSNANENKLNLNAIDLKLQLQQYQQQHQPQKQIIVKIKRKIEDEPVPAIVIERPKKRAFIDTFKNFNISSGTDENDNESDDNEQDDNENYVNLKKHKFHDNFIDNDFKNNNNNNNNNGILDNNISKQQQQQHVSNNNNNNNTSLFNNQQNKLTKTKEAEKEVHFFTLITTLNEPIIENYNKIDTKLQERLEELRATVNSPKLIQKKREKLVKQRKEIRYKQIAIKRKNMSEQDREFFKDHDVIELEQTVIDNPIDKFNNLTSEEEQMLCNYKSMIMENLNTPNDRNQKPTTIQQDKYVYDYYYISQRDHLERMLEDNDNPIINAPRITLEADDDDLLDFSNVCSDDESSDDSQNFYKEYPSGDESDYEIEEEYDLSAYEEEKDDFYESYGSDDEQNFVYNQYVDDMDD